jgi:hypothetical protein
MRRGVGSRKGSSVVSCPRCGGLGYWAREVREGPRGRHAYVYVVHVEGGRRRKCYLGAEAYDYVERFHGLGLAGDMDGGRWRRYAEQLIDRLKPEDLRWLLGMIRERLGDAGA